MSELTALRLHRDTMIDVIIIITCTTNFHIMDENIALITWKMYGICGKRSRYLETKYKGGN